MGRKLSNNRQERIDGNKRYIFGEAICDLTTTKCPDPEVSCSECDRC